MRHKFRNGGYFKASGTWIFEDGKEKMAFPLQTTEIKCYRNLGICVEVEAYIGYGDMLMVDSELYEIERWDAYEIMTKPYDYESVRYFLRVNKLHKTVKKYRTTLKTKEDSKGIDIQDKYMKLIDGFEVWCDVRDEKNAAFKETWSKSIKEAFEKEKK